MGLARLEIYARLSPEGDRRTLGRPEFKAMFLERDWAFRLDEVKVPVRWWHGDHDHIVPFAHGQHVVAKLPEASLTELPYESQLGGLGYAREIVGAMIEVWESGKPG